MKPATIIIVAVSLLVILVLSGTFYTVDETEQVVITQFGKPIGNAITKPGLKVKIPFIQKTNYYDKRFLGWDSAPNQIPTKDKKYIWVDTYARWRIEDAMKFLTSVVNEDRAQARLDNIIDNATRNEISSLNLIEVVRNSDREMAVAEEELQISEDVIGEGIELGRDKITNLIKEQAAEKAKQYGIDIVDVRIKRINYIDEVRRKVYERMIAERTRIAEKYRSEGMGRKAEIEGEMEKELKRITSEAYRTAQEIKGDADAKATNIYANAYNKDPEFYSFLQTLETYKETLTGETWLILGTDSDYLRYLKER